MVVVVETGIEMGDNGNGGMKQGGDGVDFVCIYQHMFDWT